MTQGSYTIVSNRPLTEQVFELVLSGDGAAVTAPGQFVNLKIEGFFLRRPISVCDREEGSVTLLYKLVGAGTRKLSTMRAGETLDVLAGLGNGYDTVPSGDTPLLIGGGVGIPPLYLLCKTLRAEGKTPTVILGFNTRAEEFYRDKFAALGVPVLVTTADGSDGIHGFVTDAMKRCTYSYFYACGPTAMLRAVDAAASGGGQMSLEERMGCGFGACMGCTCQTKSGAKRVCKDGPVFRREEIIW